MNRKLLSVLVLLPNLVVMVACGGPSMPAPRPVATTDLSSVTLAPYTESFYGVTGVLPEGWFRVDRGVYLAGPPEDQPVTVHLLQVLGGMTLAQAQEYLLAWLNLDEFPEPLPLLGQVCSFSRCEGRVATGQRFVHLPQRSRHHAMGSKPEEQVERRCEVSALVRDQESTARAQRAGELIQHGDGLAPVMKR